jgi:hypothetical protein
MPAQLSGQLSNVSLPRHIIERYGINVQPIAVQFIYSGNADLRMSDAPATTPWCLYLAVLTIYAYGSLTEGPADFSDLPFVFRPSTGIRIEPSLARRNALAYVDRLLSCGESSRLPTLHNKNACGGVLAYAVHLISAIDWGIREHKLVQSSTLHVI